MICELLKCGLMNWVENWVVRTIDGMGFRVDMHGWSEGCVDIPRQSDRNSE